MTIAFWCVLIAGFMPVAWQVYAKLTIIKNFDNGQPRHSLEQLSGAGQRARWAHDNSWEAFAPFAAAVIIAHLVQVAPATIDSIAMIFIGARLAYGLAYIFDHPTLRSVVWSLGTLCVLALYVTAAAS